MQFLTTMYPPPTFSKLVTQPVNVFTIDSDASALQRRLYYKPDRLLGFWFFNAVPDLSVDCLYLHFKDGYIFWGVRRGEQIIFNFISFFYEYTEESCNVASSGGNPATVL